VESGYRHEVEVVGYWRRSCRGSRRRRLVLVDASSCAGDEEAVLMDVWMERKFLGVKLWIWAVVISWVCLALYIGFFFH
jgi:hypothetical protein